MSPKMQQHVRVIGSEKHINSV